MSAKMACTSVKRLTVLLSVAAGVGLVALLCWALGPAATPAAHAAPLAPAQVSLQAATVISTTDWTAYGESTSHRFGNTVAPAGDVNGDGFADLIVSASQGQRVYVYPGDAAGLGVTPVITFVGTGSFGRIAAGAGDVNGDGYADVAISAPDADTNRGRVYLYHGSSGGLTTTPALTLTGELTTARFGLVLAPAGDVNGDGYADLVIGAPAYNSNQGRAYVYLGSAAGLAQTPALTLTGEAVGVYFGSGATAGDVNGDGYADVAVGSYYYATQTGRVYVYHGGASGLSATPAITFTGETTSTYFGYSVATAGDVNGDGYADLVVGAYNYGDERGRVYVYHGSGSGLRSTPAFTVTGLPLAYLGYSVATAGDLNGDGYADVVMGGYQYNQNRGIAYVYPGSRNGLTDTTVITFTSNVTGNVTFGYSVATAGDVRGDGFSALAIGEPGYPTVVTGQGRAHVYYGGGDGPTGPALFTVYGEDAAHDLGFSVATAGDVNGDGYADAIVGAPFFDSPGLADRGKIYIYHGGSAGLNTTAALSVAGAGASYELGYSVATAGDVNGDGYADVIAGAEDYAANIGRVYVYRGSAGGIVATPIFTMTGTNVRLGHSVASAGDVNGDGYADVVIGAYGYGGTYGRVYVFQGSAAGLSTTLAFSATGSLLEYLGESVASAGDVNGDGYADVVAGAYNSGSGRGAIYVYHGSRNGLDATSVYSRTGPTGGDNLGHSVASAGDVNGDGYADVIAGAPGSNDRAYVYYGGPAGLGATPAVTLALATGSSFGVAVATAGDVNGDGYADVVVGGNNYSGGRGVVAVYPGGSGGLSATPVFTIAGVNSGAGTGDWLGTAVASAGDVNGDGFADVIAGAPGYPTTEFGRVYLYQGGGGGGRTSLARPARSDGSLTPVQPWGSSAAADALTVRATVLNPIPLGRVPVRLEVQACPPGVPFGDAGCVAHTPAAWTSVSTVTVALTETIEGLQGATLYRWRARVVYNSPFLTHGRWLRPLGQAIEADARTLWAAVYLPTILRQ